MHNLIQAYENTSATLRKNLGSNIFERSASFLTSL